MTERDPLEDFFEAARNDPAQPSDALMACIAEDAARTVARPAPTPSHRPGFFAALGGWPAFAGFATAALAGVWIGVSDPLTLDPLGLVGAGGVGVADLSTGYADLDWGAE